jgi:hypothetical protein
MTNRAHPWAATGVVAIIAMRIARFETIGNFLLSLDSA